MHKMNMDLVLKEIREKTLNISTLDEAIVDFGIKEDTELKIDVIQTYLRTLIEFDIIENSAFSNDVNKLLKRILKETNVVNSEVFKKLPDYDCNLLKSFCYYLEYTPFIKYIELNGSLYLIENNKNLTIVELDIDDKAGLIEKEEVVFDIDKEKETILKAIRLEIDDIEAYDIYDKNVARYIEFMKRFIEEQ